jgi:hypothetical protein
MTEYDYHNLPEELDVKPVDEEMNAEVLEVIQEAIAAGHVRAHEAKAAYVFRRGEEMSFDTLGKPRNKSYGDSSDDIVLQVTVRIGGERYVRNELPGLVALEEGLTARHEAAEQAKLEAEIAEAEQAEAAAKAKAEQAAERLAQLKAKKQG